MAKIDWSRHNYHREVGFTEPNPDEAYKREVEWGKLKFGKHKGKTLQEVPVTYLKWIANTWQPNSKFAKATINNAKHEISQRQNIASQQKRTEVESPKISVQDANKH